MVLYKCCYYYYYYYLITREYVEFLCQQVKHTFASIPKDVQYVYIEHGGSDSQFWRGHYGPKITATSVMVNCS